MDRVQDATGERCVAIELDEVVLDVPNEFVVLSHARLSLRSSRASASTASRRYFSA
jgi:hypothetical protein